MVERIEEMTLVKHQFKRQAEMAVVGTRLSARH